MLKFFFRSSTTAGSKSTTTERGTYLFPMRLKITSGFPFTLSFSDAGWGLLRTIHDWSGLAMAILVLVHLILNWGWIIETTKEYFKKKENLKEIPK